MDKIIVAAGCFAALFVLGADASFVAAFLTGVAVAALCEYVPLRVSLVLLCAYCLAAVAFPLLVVSLPLVAYECARSNQLWLRGLWVVPLLAGFFQLSLPAACIVAATCATACALSWRTATLSHERGQYRVLRDTVREQAIVLEERNRALKQDLAESRDKLRNSGIEADALGEQASAGPDHPAMPAADAYPSLVFANLTERELEVAAHVAQGLDNKEIASAVFASEGTVRNHISSILQKTGLRNRTQVAIAYLEHTGRA